MANPAETLTVTIDPATGIILAATPSVKNSLGLDTASLPGKHVCDLCPGQGMSRRNDEVTRFVHSAAHDLVGPLNQASTLAGLFLRKYRGEFDGEAAELARHMQTVAERMESLARGARRYLELTGAEARFELVDMRAVVEAALLSCPAQIKETGAQIACEALPRVRGDASLLIAMVSELLNNALTFRRDDCAPKIDLTYRAAGAYILFEVKDNGIGIPCEYVGSLFQVFRRLQGKRYPGVGLGLAIVKRIVELHRGSVWIESEVNQGTKVVFTLPSECGAAVAE
jgi:light-regulated signal transduction histidine kinase (bacteriophytochrome)